jgi:hypothetical protein
MRERHADIYARGIESRVIRPNGELTADPQSRVVTLYVEHVESMIRHIAEEDKPKPRKAKR